MTLLKSTTYLGVSPFSVDVGADFSPDLINNAQSDAAGTLDDLTSSSSATPIDHSGESFGKGGQLGIPLAVQSLHRSLRLNTGGAKNGGIDGQRLQFPYIVAIPVGETAIDVEATFTNNAQTSTTAVYIRLCSLTDFNAAVGTVLEQTARVSPQNEAREVAATATFRGCSSGAALVVIEVDDAVGRWTDGDASWLPAVIRDVVIRPSVVGRVKAATVASTTSATVVNAPAASEALAFQQIDDVAAKPTNPTTAWHASRVNRNLRAQEEWLRADPAGGNASYTATESALRNPARDRFYSLSRKTFTTQPIPIVPLTSVCLGAVKSGGYFAVDALVPGALEAYAPYALSTAEVELATILSMVPDVPSTMLRWAVLLGSAQSSPPWSSIRCRVRIESLALSSLVTPTAITGAPHLAFVTGTGLAFSPDATASRLRVLTSQVSGAYDPYNYCVVAAAVWVQP